MLKSNVPRHPVWKYWTWWKHPLKYTMFAFGDFFFIFSRETGLWTYFCRHVPVPPIIFCLSCLHFMLRREQRSSWYLDFQRWPRLKRTWLEKDVASWKVWLSSNQSESINSKASPTLKSYLEFGYNKHIDFLIFNFLIDFFSISIIIIIFYNWV